MNILIILYITKIVVEIGYLSTKKKTKDFQDIRLVIIIIIRTQKKLTA